MATMWTGIYVDKFSPDDQNCPESLRYIDVRNGELEISASGTGDGCEEVWGRRFNGSDTVNPIIHPEASKLSLGKTSFISKVGEEDAMYEYAQKGALNFTLTVGHVDDGTKVIMWNSVYDGEGGPMPPDGSIAEGSDCDNFWALN
eukprot:CAMPEP_0182467636 /NCGR_PEP_ID=MMETSP1319-20130603/14287_1 /TAXON_ID=172717 /ORGANISM="Bolidomonas pacifica, Strain RCC208" /LENGTH=144 /DNA_ID=CAMNT_0024667743 /DNA_START=29 /DNA_END=463 /DNA_ORIENTATION=+